jgi:hypothetical protein
MTMLALIAALAASQPAAPLPTIDVTAPTDVTRVRAVNDALGAMSEKVTGCVKGGGAPEACQCRFPAQLAALRKGYDALIRERPEWKDRMLSYQFINQEGRNISGTLVLQSLRRQLEILTCQ